MLIERSDPATTIAFLEMRSAESDTKDSTTEIARDARRADDSRHRAEEAQHRAAAEREKAEHAHSWESGFASVAKVASAVSGVASVVALAVPVTAPIAGGVACAAGVVAGGAKIGEGISHIAGAKHDKEAAVADIDRRSADNTAAAAHDDAMHAVDHIKDASAQESQGLRTAARAAADDHASRMLQIMQLGGAL